MAINYSNGNKGIQPERISITKVSKYIKNLSNIGIDFSIIANKKSKTVEVDDDIYSQQNITNSSLMMGNNLNIEPTTYYSQNYIERRKFLRKFSAYPEIEYTLDCLCDDTIILDDYKKYCKLNVDSSKVLTKSIEIVDKNFSKIYNMLKFDYSNYAWTKFREWLIDGVIAWEIVYDYKTRGEINKEIININNQIQNIDNILPTQTDEKKKNILLMEKERLTKKIKDIKRQTKVYESYCVPMETKNEGDLIPVRIIGFVELDPTALCPVDVYDDKNRKVKESEVKLWKYQRDNKEIILSDNQVIYLSYYENNTSGNLSYVERLIRNFNLKRKMEDSTVGWFIMNSQTRMKMIVPIGNKTTDKARQALQNLTNRYQEELVIDFESGEVTINGQPRISYSKNIVLPSRQGSTPSIDTLQNSGPDLSNMKVVDYFDKNLKRDTRLPNSRYDREKDGGKVILFKADGITYEDLSYNNFRNRLRSTFEEAILKPLIIQSILDIPELKIDESFKTSISLTYEDNFLFNEAKKDEVLKARLDTIKLYDNIKNDKDEPVFSRKYLYVEKYHLFSAEEWERNEQLRKEEVEKSKEQ